jgi:hypothetical protein
LQRGNAQWLNMLQALKQKAFNADATNLTKHTDA